MIQRWNDEPIPYTVCTCAHRIVATIEETLACPAGFRFRAGIGFIHALRVNR